MEIWLVRTPNISIISFIYSQCIFPVYHLMFPGPYFENVYHYRCSIVVAIEKKDEYLFSRVSRFYINFCHQTGIELIPYNTHRNVWPIYIFIDDVYFVLKVNFFMEMDHETMTSVSVDFLGDYSRALIAYAKTDVSTVSLASTNTLVSQTRHFWAAGSVGNSRRSVGPRPTTFA